MTSQWRSALLRLLWSTPLCMAAHAADGGDVTAQALWQSGQAALQAGESRQALDAFERAAALEHSAPIEIGIVNALMQGGQYQRALAFAAHTAFAHADEPDAVALYVLLLRSGGQVSAARRMLAQALQRAPDDAGLLRAQALLDAPDDGPELRAAFERLAPVVNRGASLPPDAAVIAQATLLPDGQHALTPSAPLDGATLWLRNGVGRIVRAEVERRDADVVLLRLLSPFDGPPAILASRIAYPGTPAYVVAFDASLAATARWPQLRVGFLGAVARDGTRALGVPMDTGSGGAPVFDAAGRLSGVALPSSTGEPLLFHGLASQPGALAAPVSDAPPPRMAIDAVYELGLRCALQLIAARP